MDEKKSCGSCKHDTEGGCSLDAENVCLKSHGWDQNGPYTYVCWEGFDMNKPKIPTGFVMIYTETHSICMRVDHIISVAVSCVQDSILHITTRDGENYKAAYNFEEFLNLIDSAKEDRK